MEYLWEKLIFSYDCSKNTFLSVG